MVMMGLRELIRSRRASRLIPVAVPESEAVAPPTGRAIGGARGFGSGFVSFDKGLFSSQTSCLRKTLKER